MPVFCLRLRYDLVTSCRLALMYCPAQMDNLVLLYDLESRNGLVSKYRLVLLNNILSMGLVPVNSLASVYGLVPVYGLVSMMVLCYCQVFCHCMVLYHCIVQELTSVQYGLYHWMILWYSIILCNYMLLWHCIVLVNCMLLCGMVTIYGLDPLNIVVPKCSPVPFFKV